MGKDSKPAKLPWGPEQAGKRPPDKGGALNLEIEEALHNKGLMEGQNEQRG